MSFPHLHEIPPLPHYTPFHSLTEPIALSSLPSVCQNLQTALPSKSAFQIIQSLVFSYGLCAAYQCQSFYGRLQNIHKQFFAKYIADIWSRLRDITGGFVPAELEFMKGNGGHDSKGRLKYTLEPEITPNRAFEKELDKIREIMQKTKIEEIGEVSRTINVIKQRLEKEYELNYLQRSAIDILEKKYNAKWMPSWRVYSLENRLQTQIPKSPLYPCCRTFFFLGEPITEQSHKLQFLEDLDDTLAEIVCGFLNTKGGMVLIGVKREYNNRVKPVHILSKKNYDIRIGYKLAGIRKQSTLSNFVKVEYVPVKDTSIIDNVYYVVRITVKNNPSLSVFPLKQDKKQRFFVRKLSETAQLSQTDFYDYQVQRIELDISQTNKRIQPLFHEGLCVKEINPPSFNILLSVPPTQRSTSVAPNPAEGYVPSDLRQSAVDNQKTNNQKRFGMFSRMYSSFSSDKEKVVEEQAYNPTLLNH